MPEAPKARISREIPAEVAGAQRGEGPSDGRPGPGNVLQSCNILCDPGLDWRSCDMLWTRTLAPMRPARRKRAPGRSSAGFTIVEALAALLVIAVGFIGIAALYSEHARVNESDLPQARAAAMAEAIAARVRATREGRDGYATTVGVVCDPTLEPKLPLDAAAQEAACWEDEVERTLPSGLGTITRDISTHPVSYVVAVSWSTPEAGTASYVLRVVPKD